MKSKITLLTMLLLIAATSSLQALTVIATMETTDPTVDIAVKYTSTSGGKIYANSIVLPDDGTSTSITANLGNITLEADDDVTLTYLACYDNALTSLDVTQCVNLAELYCDRNSLSSLDVSQCVNLVILNCSYNSTLSSLDVSQCPLLEDFLCNDNNLTSLDVSQCPLLCYFDCYNNHLTSLDVLQCPLLIDFYCRSNNLTSLDVSQCTLLIELSCRDNNLTSLDLSQCPDLEYLFCYNNNLTSLDVSQCTYLEYLDCFNNNLTSLDVSQCPYLEYLYCNNNKLTSLDLSQCPDLRFLYCYNNNLTSLDLSQSTDLEYLYCSNNNLTSLNVTNCQLLYYLECYNNNLTSLNVSQCTNLYSLNCSLNSLISLDVTQLANLVKLYCIYNSLTSLNVSQCPLLDDLICSDNNLTELNLMNCTLLDNVQARNQFIPVFSSGGIFTNPVSYTNRTTLEPIIIEGSPYNENDNLPFLSGDMKTFTTGIIGGSGNTAFSGTIGFDSNTPPPPLVKMETTANTMDIKLEFTGTGKIFANGMEELSSGIAITINVYGGKLELTFDDDVTLTSLNLKDCHLTSLDISQCTDLVELNCGSNSLTSLDLTNNINLGQLQCYSNSLTSLDVSSCTNLVELNCALNLLTNLDVSNCVDLENLICAYNSLTSLDVSQCINLTQLWCTDNNLEELNIDNCSLLTDIKARNQFVPVSLTGSDYKNPIEYTDNTGSVEPITIESLPYNKNDNLPFNSGDMKLFTTPLIGSPPNNAFSGTIGFDVSTPPPPLVKMETTNNIVEIYLEYTGSGNIYAYGVIELINNTSNFVDVYGGKLELTADNGVSLTFLDIYDEYLTSLDVSQCTDLELLGCSNTSLTSLDVSQCQSLKELYCQDNSLTSLILSTSLVYLSCFNNALNSLDVSQCTNLIDLSCYNNALSSLDVSQCTNLIELDCEYNAIASLDVSHCPSLYHLRCSYNALSELNLKDCALLTEVRAHNQSVKALASGVTYPNPIEYTNLTSIEPIQISANTFAKGVDLQPYPTVGNKLTFTTAVIPGAPLNTAFGGKITLIGYTPGGTDNTPPTLPVTTTITVTGKTHNSISLSWNAASDNSTPQGQLLYTVRWRVTGTPGWTSSNALAGATAFTISGLAANTDYEIEVIVTDLNSNSNSYPLITVKTNQASSSSISVISVSINQLSLPLVLGSTSQLTAGILPANATNKTVTWNSSDPAIATVSLSGLVTAIAPGITIITVTTSDGNKTATCQVVVTDPGSIPGTGNDNIGNASLSAYPNPTSGMITITGLTPDKVLKIYSAVGTLVGSYTAQGEEMTINLSHLSKGLYYINIEGKTIKVIKD